MSLELLKKLHEAASPSPWPLEVAQGEARVPDPHDRLYTRGIFYAYAAGPTLECPITLDPTPLMGQAQTDARLLVFMREIVPYFLSFAQAYDNLEGGGCGECPSGLEKVNDAWMELHKAADRIGRSLSNALMED